MDEKETGGSEEVPDVSTFLEDESELELEMDE